MTTEITLSVNDIARSLDVLLNDVKNKLTSLGLGEGTHGSAPASLPK